MKSLLLISLLSLLSLSQSLPHFTYDGLESYHDCSGETEKFLSQYMVLYPKN